MSLARASFGDTIGTVSMVLTMAMSNSAVKVSLVMMPLSSKMLAKIIVISALVCNSQPMMAASPGAQPRIFPAMCVASNFPTTAANSNTPAAMNTAAPPTDQSVRSPALKNYTGIMIISTLCLSISICF